MLRVSFLRVPLLAILAVAMAVIVGGCGGEDAPPGGATPTPTPTAEELLERTSRRLADTPSVHFTLDVEGETFVDRTRTIRLLDANGDLLRPDRVRTTFRAEVLGRAITLQLISVGDRSWTTDLITGEWVPAPLEFAYQPTILFDNQAGIGPVMGRVDDVRRLPDAEVEGRPVFHLQAEVDAEVIGPLTYYTITGNPVTVDLWVDRETNDLLRAQLSEPPGAERPNPATWILELSRQGAEVDIEPPV